MPKTLKDHYDIFILEMEESWNYWYGNILMADGNCRNEWLSSSTSKAGKLPYNLYSVGAM